jgi:hypothetical protein
MMTFNGNGSYRYRGKVVIIIVTVEFQPAQNKVQLNEMARLGLVIRGWRSKQRLAAEVTRMTFDRFGYHQ